MFKDLGLSTLMDISVSTIRQQKHTPIYENKGKKH